MHIRGSFRGMRVCCFAEATEGKREEKRKRRGGRRKVSKYQQQHETDYDSLEGKEFR